MRMIISCHYQLPALTSSRETPPILCKICADRNLAPWLSAQTVRAESILIQHTNPPYYDLLNHSQRRNVQENTLSNSPLSSCWLCRSEVCGRWKKRRELMMQLTFQQLTDVAFKSSREPPSYGFRNHYNYMKCVISKQNMLGEKQEAFISTIVQQKRKEWRFKLAVVKK